jgi:hypothetical protein
LHEKARADLFDLRHAARAVTMKLPPRALYIMAAFMPMPLALAAFLMGQAMQWYCKATQRNDGIKREPAGDDRGAQ